MMIKSALMTTAGDVLDGPNTNPLVIFRQGAGHVAPEQGADPGPRVQRPAGTTGSGFLCGTQLPPSFCTGAGMPVLDPSDLNLASIAIGDLAGTQTVTRTRDQRRSDRRAHLHVSVSAWRASTVDSVAGVVHDRTRASRRRCPSRSRHARSAPQCLRGWPDHLERWQGTASASRSSCVRWRLAAPTSDGQCDLVQRDVRLRRSVLGDGTRPRGG